jgi:hypothetical protein
MIRRYKTGYTPPCFFKSNTQTSTTSNKDTYSVVVKCAKYAVVGFKVTTFINSYGLGFYTINGTGRVLNDTFSITDSGSGTFTLTIVIGWPTTPPTGNGINVILTIESTSKGKLGSPLTQGEEKVV